MPGAANLDSFESLTMEPHVFKEQMRRAFNMKLSPPELAALMGFFDPQVRAHLAASLVDISPCCANRYLHVSTKTSTIQS